jgi:hypothetical protein
MDKQHSPILISNSFPLSLIRRPVRIEPRSLFELQQILNQRPFVSFWGHANTLEVACNLLKINIKPQSERPVILLNKDNLPLADGQPCRECWLLSPDYRSGFRPGKGEEVSELDIIGWQVLKIEWE